METIIAYLNINISMGNYLSPNEQQLYQSLESQFSLQDNPYLLHRKTNQMCTLHKITTNSQEENSQISQIIEEYAKTRCESISRLKTHFYLDMRGYCSNQQNYYLIFNGRDNYTLREEFIKRKFQEEIFTEEETMQIVEAYLNGLREYNNRFQRDYQRLWLHSLAVDENGKMFLKDPWLIKDNMSAGNAEKITQLMQSYPSPQKLNAAFNSKMSDYNEFDSNLFSVGAIGLELHKLGRSGNLYIKKEVNVEEVRYRLRDIKNQKLKRGLQCLLSVNPKQRIKIYQIWGVDNKKQHFISMHGNKKKTEILQGKHQFINQDLTETRKKFNFAKNIPQTIVINKQSTCQLSPIRKTDSLWNNNTPILHLKSDMNQIVHTDSFRIPSPPKSKHVVASCQTSQVPKISFNDSKLSTPIATPQTASLSNSVIISCIPPSNYIPSNLPNKLYQKNVLKVYQPPASNLAPTQNTKFTFTIKPENFQGSNQTQFNSVTAQSFPNPKQPSVSPILGMIYKQSFTFEEKTKSPQNITNIIIPNSKPSIQMEKKGNQKYQEGEIIKKQQSPVFVKQQTGIRQQEKFSEHSQIPLIHDKNDKLLNFTDEQSAGNNINVAPQSKLEQKQTTPHRPTARNKYNSTIVEARDQESPDQSLQSEDTFEQQQYVMEEYGSGSRYQGFKSHGMRNGQGRFYYQDGGYYQGHWKNNKMDGIGKLYYENGALAYEGSWSQDQFNGLGRVYNDSPIPFKESFDYTNFDLLGDSWQYYEGMLMKDTKEGRGKIKLSNSELFEGDFHHDRIQGFGKFHTLDGKLIEGIWREARLIKVINNHNRDN